MTWGRLGVWRRNYSLCVAGVLHDRPDLLVRRLVGGFRDHRRRTIELGQRLPKWLGSDRPCP
jgi:hypothetical protein